jgi:hypothetical protein
VVHGHGDAKDEAALYSHIFKSAVVSEIAMQQVTPVSCTFIVHFDLRSNFLHFYDAGKINKELLWFSGPCAVDSLTPRAAQIRPKHIRYKGACGSRGEGL